MAFNRIEKGTNKFGNNEPMIDCVLAARDGKQVKFYISYDICARMGIVDCSFVSVMLGDGEDKGKICIRLDHSRNAKTSYKLRQPTKRSQGAFAVSGNRIGTGNAKHGNKPLPFFLSTEGLIVNIESLR